MKEFNWPEIRLRYIVNGESPTQLGREYNVSPKTISNRAALGGWKEERELHLKDLKASLMQRQVQMCVQTMDMVNTAMAAIKARLQEPSLEEPLDPILKEAMKLANVVIVNTLNLSDTVENVLSKPDYKTIYTSTGGHHFGEEPTRES